MVSEMVFPDQTVLIRNGQIETVGSSADIKVPRKTTVIDGRGAWLMPGLADMHVHTSDAWTGPAWPVNPLELYLANGVTTIRSLGPLGSDPGHVLRWRSQIAEGKIAGPSIYTSGPILYGPVPDPAGEIHRQKEQGYDFVKIYSFLTRLEFDAVMKTAKETGIYTTGHIPFLVGLDGVFDQGMDEIAHIEEIDFEFLDINPDLRLSRIDIIKGIISQAAEKFRDDLKADTPTLIQKHGNKIREIARKLGEEDIPVCTTLVIGQGIVSKLYDPVNFMARPVNRYLPDAYLQTFRLGQEKHQFMFRGHEDLAPFKYRMERILAKELKRAGVPLLLGTDSGTGGMGIVPGFSIHDELHILNEIGFSPYEALRSGTVNAAGVIRKITGKGNFGTIEPGNRADLLLAGCNPLEDVACVREPLGVMAAGNWYPEAKLDAMLSFN
jgi:hypothetical protein